MAFIGPKKPSTLIQRSRSKRPEEKAAYHHIVGAGKSHVKREFFGLSARDEDAIVERMALGLDELLRQQQ